MKKSNPLVPQLPELDTRQSIAPKIKEPDSLEWLMVFSFAVMVLVGFIYYFGDVSPTGKPFFAGVGAIAFLIGFCANVYNNWLKKDTRDSVLCFVAVSETGRRLLNQADDLLAKWSDHQRDVRCYRRLKRRLGAQATATVRAELQARSNALLLEARVIRASQEELKTIYRRQLAAEKMAVQARASE